MYRSAIVLVVILVGSLVMGGYFSYWSAVRSGIQFKRVSFQELPGWQRDSQRLVFRAFVRSCPKLLMRSRYLKPGSELIAMKTTDWRAVCRAGERLTHMTNQRAREFFQRWFVPLQVSINGSTQGLFTGYYAPTLYGSLRKHGAYRWPIYARPKNLVMVSLTLFDQGRDNIWGRVSRGQLMPYYKRSEINRGVLRHRAKVLAWVNNRAERFFLQVQGSGLIQLANHHLMWVGYAGQNGMPYYAIGRVLVDKGIFTRKTVSMQGILHWLRSHPEEEAELLSKNPSFIFFRQLKHSPLGTLQVALTPGRSIAVDKRIIPLGVPIWLVTKHPSATNPDKLIDMQHLMVAQDTGGAIKGAIRGDVYWGPGERAAAIAGHMHSQGRWWILLPKVVANENHYY